MPASIAFSVARNAVSEQVAEIQKDPTKTFADVKELMAGVRGRENVLRDGDTDGGIKIYNAIAANAALAQPFRDVALLKATRLEFDTLAPDVVIARMKPLSTPGGPWFGVAGEMTAVAYLKAGKPALAEPLFTAIAICLQARATTSTSRRRSGLMRPARCSSIRKRERVIWAMVAARWTERCEGL